MTDRDTFAAAALTGMLAQGDDGSFSEESYVRAAYRWADIMIRERDRHIPDAGENAETTSRTVPDAWATAYAVTRACEIANHDALPEATANAESVAPQPTAGDRSGNPTSRSGTGDSLSEAEIDALECVVEDGRIVGMSVYGRLRSLLVRLRPEWEGEGDSDRPKPINDERLAALEQLSALDQELELEYGLTGNPLIKARRCKAAKTDTTQPRNGTPADGSVQAEGSVPDSRNANEPVAWAVRRVCGKWVSILENAVQAETSRQSFDKMENWVHEVVPLYRHPQPALTDAERAAVEKAADLIDNKTCGDSSTLRGLLERLK